MRTKLLSLILLLSVCFAAKAEDNFYFAKPNAGAYDGNNGAVVALVYVEGVQCTEYDRYEVAAFCDTYEGAVMGRQMLIDIHAGFPVLMMIIYGNPGDVLYFKIYDHATNTLFDGVCLQQVVYQPDVEFGTLADPETMQYDYPANCIFEDGTNMNWSTEANWTPRTPCWCDTAIINGACIVDGGAEPVYAKLVVSDGSQLDPNGNEITAIFEKNIAAYTGTKDSYYFIANPTGSDILTTGNMLTGDFDLYFFDAEGVDEETEELPYEWQNYKSTMYENHADFVPSDNGNGYMYANAAETVLEFTGEVNDASAAVTYTYAYTSGEHFPGFHLTGNTLPVNATVTGGAKYAGYYTMNEGRNEVIAVTNPVVAPCTAFFAVLGSSGGTAAARRLTLTPNMGSTVNTRSIASVINIELNNNEGLLDRACIRFNELDNLQKLSMNQNASHIYFNENGKDYAILQANEKTIAIPMLFETKEYGEYTIKVNLENLTCGYLHLIDNITGADIDLNVTPYYTFRANASDYESRFRIMFTNTGVEENKVNNFAIVEGNRVIIPAIESESNLEIIDMTGRIISSSRVNGSYDEVLNVKAGVYMLRLNGNVQKIVIR